MDGSPRAARRRARSCGWERAKGGPNPGLGIVEARTGIEPVYKDLQSSA